MSESTVDKEKARNQWETTNIKQNLQDLQH